MDDDGRFIHQEDQQRHKDKTANPTLDGGVIPPWTARESLLVQTSPTERRGVRSPKHRARRSVFFHFSMVGAILIKSPPP